jgi:hypothetical protein
MYDLYPIVYLLILVENLKRRIRRAIIHTYYLHILESLSKKRAQALFKILLAIIDGN